MNDAPAVVAILAKEAVVAAAADEDVVAGPAVDLGVSANQQRDQDEVIAAAAIHDDAGDRRAELPESLAVGPDHQLAAGGNDV